MRNFYYKLKDKVYLLVQYVFSVKDLFYVKKVLNYFFIFTQNFSRAHKPRIKNFQKFGKMRNRSVYFQNYNFKRFNFFRMVAVALRNNFLILFYYNFFKNSPALLFLNFLSGSGVLKRNAKHFLEVFKQTFGEGFLYIRGLLIIFFVDACLTDDEPLWEPIEWSLFQTWLFFIFTFAWIAENLITSRYGSFTGRDKRVWLAWYKSFWLIELMYIVSYGSASMFVIVPFYYELTYSLPFIYSWWNWYTKVFFFKFISLYTVALLTAYLLQVNLRWFNWKKIFFFIIAINVFIAYLLYTHFIMVFFAYFTDPLWYQKTRFIDYIQLSHEPLKWGWGPAKRDHFTYHKVSTVFWFKNDAPFAGAFLMFHLFLFLCLFFLYIYWIVLLRRVYTTKEATYTFTVYCVSSLKQFFLFFLLLFVLVFISFIVCYWRFPIEFIWVSNSHSWLLHFFQVWKDYFFFLITLLF